MKGPTPKPAIDRFKAKVKVGPPSASRPDLGPCLLWTAAADPRGYGRFAVGSLRDGSYRMALAHRWSYEYHIGPIPDGLQIDHLCRVPACVNHLHLEAVTGSENTVRGDLPAVTRARNAARTHCVHGHEYTEATTRLRVVKGSVHRSCLECEK